MSLGFKLAEILRDEFEISEAESIDLAAKLVAHGAKRGLAGREHYWPTSFKPVDTATRNEAIRREFTGRNLREICAKYDVSHQTVYLVVRSV